MMQNVIINGQEEEELEKPKHVTILKRVVTTAFRQSESKRPMADSLNAAA